MSNPIETLTTGARMNLPVHISIGRWAGGEAGTSFRLTVSDDSSGTQLLHVEITPAQFADLVSGSDVGTTATANFAHAGMTCEVKHIEVSFPPLTGTREEQVRQAAGIVDQAGRDLDARTSSPGTTPWCGRVTDALNAHRVVVHTTDGGRTAQISYRRFVPRVEGV